MSRDVDPEAPPESGSAGRRQAAQDERAAEAERLDRAIRELQRGHDRDGNFRLLYDRFYPAVYGFLARRVYSPEDRLDLTQETFVRIYKGLRTFKGDARFSTWLYRITYNVFLKWSQQRVAQGPGGPPAPPPGDFEEIIRAWPEDQAAADENAEQLGELLKKEQLDALREAIEGLPTQMRRCMELRVYQDLRYREIATVMSLSIETVKVHLLQARKKLRASLGETFEEIDF